jgi:hypothetical protein
VKQNALSVAATLAKVLNQSVTAMRGPMHQKTGVILKRIGVDLSSVIVCPT